MKKSKKLGRRASALAAISMQILSLFGRMDEEASAVLFAGMGGACQGILEATGVSPIVAANHDPHAIELHKKNHPDTIHLQENVLELDPLQAARGRAIRLLWLSPDCCHFSRAKGGKPLSRGRRSLAAVAVYWARTVKPLVIILENVLEFTTWGPLHPITHPDPKLRGQPIKERAGEFFQAWLRGLRRHGYEVEWRVLNAADYGAPTSRRRLFLVARRDGKAFAWPEPSHGPGRAQPYRTAAECIDWSIPTRSIFDRDKPLAEATERRLAQGVMKFVVNNPRPYIVQTGHQSSDSGKVRSVDQTLSTVVTKAEHCLVAPVLSKAHTHGWDNGAGPAWEVDKPLRTITAKDATVVAAASLTKFYKSGDGAPIDQPCPTLTAQVNKIGLVSAFLAKHYTGVVGSPLERPIGTITAVDHHSLVEVVFSAEQTAGAERVLAFIMKYYGAEQGQCQGLDEPLHTVPCHDRFALITVHIDGEAYIITDIRMRMLQPRELARAMGFPDSYILEGSKAQQVARIGNAVCPPVAAALVRSMLYLNNNDHYWPGERAAA